MEQLRLRKIKNLFLQQSHMDCWEDYRRSLYKERFITWDHVILTASNEAQAEAYREQIAYRLEHGLLPEKTAYAVLPDPEGKRVGSGGATFHVLRYIAEQTGEEAASCFLNKRILVIHSGGDSKRVPQYSACGKLFSPVPRELPDGRASTIFDEFIIGMSGIPSRIKEGMLVLSGDVLLLFNPLQIDFQFQGAAAISIKEPVETGKEHGVFLNDGNDYVGAFLHKQSEAALRERGAVNDNGYVDLDTGAVIMDGALLQALFSLISTDGRVDEKKYAEFVNEQARISFYGDFLYPLAREATLEQYYLESPEGSFCEELRRCREKIWQAISAFQMKLLCLSPAEFIHFGTTRELLQLVTIGVEDYEFLGWRRSVACNIPLPEQCAAAGSLVEGSCTIGCGSYVEDSYLLDGTEVGKNSVISSVRLQGRQLPGDIVLHGLKLNNGSYVVRVYGVQDNPKGLLTENASLLGIELNAFLKNNGLAPETLWDDEERCLWFARLYPVCETMEEALDHAQLICRMCRGEAEASSVEAWKSAERMSLYSSFNAADVSAILPWKVELKNQVLAEKFLERLKAGAYYEECLQVFGETGIDEQQLSLLLKLAEQSGYSLKMRIYFALSAYMKRQKVSFSGINYDAMLDKCFGVLRETIYESVLAQLKRKEYRIAKDSIKVQLPVRVNWGGGWTDTPPYCNECGGVVLNAAISLRGVLPIQVEIRRLSELHVEFASVDVGAQGVITELGELQDCHNPYDPFALHKAALIACGVVPLHGGGTLQELLSGLGGGFYLATRVVNVPKGSGLGTSSILAGACVKGIFEFLGVEATETELFDIVLSMEQLMSTGGGWQDQVGGLAPGIKFITTRPGVKQDINIEQVHVDEAVKKELRQRFALIYTGQRRLARNLLRDVVGGYIGGRRESVEALREMQKTAALMRFALERGDVDWLAALFNEHWELSKQLDAGSTNTCIEQIFRFCEDLIDGRFIAGAGGGGFLQVILKRGVTQEKLQERLKSIYQDSGVDVWSCELWEG